HLKHAIMQRPLGGDQTHPQSQYAIEGREYFDEMWLHIRERVTNTIFKVRFAAPEAARRGVRANLTAQHDDATGAGFAAGAAGDREAALRAQGEAAKPQTIRREQRKVGRNEPCPCGSGKKYKQCCGRR
ncbi:MAG: SEC-C domain-containing protein, partial [Phycisphaerales bacterium]